MRRHKGRINFKYRASIYAGECIVESSRAGADNEMSLKQAVSTGKLPLFKEIVMDRTFSSFADQSAYRTLSARTTGSLPYWDLICSAVSLHSWIRDDESCPIRILKVLSDELQSSGKREKFLSPFCNS